MNIMEGIILDLVIKINLLFELNKKLIYLTF
jgi:hypothetical protein